MQPGVFCVNTPASDGSRYTGFLSTNLNSQFSESIGQQLAIALSAGVTYIFKADIAYPKPSYCGGIGASNGLLEIWGGTSPCSRGKLLWTSDTIHYTDTAWTAHVISFYADSNYTFLRFCLSKTSGIGMFYVLVDNLSPFIYEVRPVIEITSPSNQDARSCAFTVSGSSDSIPVSVQLTGKFNGSPVTATMLSDSTWNATIAFSSAFSEADTIIAVGTYPSGYIARDTVVVIVNCPDTLQIKIPNLFTPNNDGYNDTFVIENLTGGCELIVFNRWGKKIYHSETYANNWNGDLVSDGIYFFHLKMNSQLTKGWLEIRR